MSSDLHSLERHWAHARFRLSLEGPRSSDGGTVWRGCAASLAAIAARPAQAGNKNPAQESTNASRVSSSYASASSFNMEGTQKGGLSPKKKVRGMAWHGMTCVLLCASLRPRRVRTPLVAVTVRR